MFTKPKVNSTVNTVKTAVKNQQQKKPVVAAKPIVTKPTPTTPRNVQSDNERQQPRQLSKSPRITKPQTTGPSNQFEHTVPSECQHCSGTGFKDARPYGDSCEHCGGHGIDPRHPDHPDHPDHEEKLEISDPEYYHHVHHVDEDGTAGAVMSVGGGSVEGLTDPNVGYAAERKRKQVGHYKNIIKGMARRKVPVL